MKQKNKEYSEKKGDEKYIMAVVFEEKLKSKII